MNWDGHWVVNWQARIKSALPELIGEIISWVWIIASLLSTYFLIAALFLGGAWSSFFWAMGVAVVAKWIAEGFWLAIRDNQQRLAFEAELVAQGYSPEEAAKEWLSGHIGQK